MLQCLLKSLESSLGNRDPWSGCAESYEVRFYPLSPEVQSKVDHMYNRIIDRQV